MLRGVALVDNPRLEPIFQDREHLQKMRRDEVNPKSLLREYLGRWPIVSGALSLWIGLVLVVLGPKPGQGAGTFLHRAAYEGIIGGLALILIGIAVRRATRS